MCDVLSGFCIDDVGSLRNRTGSPGINGTRADLFGKDIGR